MLMLLILSSAVEADGRKGSPVAVCVAAVMRNEATLLLDDRPGEQNRLVEPSEVPGSDGSDVVTQMVHK